MALFGTLIAYLIAISMIAFAAGYKALNTAFTPSKEVPNKVGLVGLGGIAFLVMLVCF
jgi:hypothetical protein